MLRQRLIRFMLDTFGMVQSSLVGQLKMSWPTREMRSISFVPSHLCQVQSPWLANSRLGTPPCKVRLFQPDPARPDQISPGHRPGMADPRSPRGEYAMFEKARPRAFFEVQAWLKPRKSPPLVVSRTLPWTRDPTC